MDQQPQDPDTLLHRNAVYVFGSGKWGRLGLGGETHHGLPMLLPLNDYNIVQCAGGGGHSLFLTDSGKVLACGGGDFAQAGQSRISNTMVPEIIAALSEYRVVQVAAGYSHSGVILEDGSLYLFGEGKWGKIGSGSETDAVAPTLIDRSRFAGERIRALALGFTHSAAITESGRLYQWGGGELGQLGQGTVVNLDTPQLVKRLSQRVVSQVSLGRSHTVALTNTGEVFTWGEGMWGKLGTGFDHNEHEPVLIPSLSDKEIVQVAAGYSHSGARTASGEIWMWGGGELGQLGLGNRQNAMLPRRVEWLIEHEIRVRSLSLGCAHTMIVSEHDEVYAWGEQKWGKLGVATNTDLLIPTRVDLLYRVSVACCGYAHSIIVTNARLFQFHVKHPLPVQQRQLDISGTEASSRTRKRGSRSAQPGTSTVQLQGDSEVDDGSGRTPRTVPRSEIVVCVCGSGKWGRMGLGSEDHSSVLRRLPEFHDENEVVIQASAGGGHSFWLTSQGNVYACGGGDFGQTGMGRRKNFLSPEFISSLASLPVMQVVCGYAHSGVVTKDGRAWVCGEGKWGKLGLGDKRDRKRLTPINSLSRVKFLAMGFTHSAAIIEDGTLWMWGGGELGQLGCNSRQNSLVPVLVEDLTSGVIGVSLGRSHSIALTADGRTFSWGEGVWGKLGLGHENDMLRPTELECLRPLGVLAIRAGYSHSGALVAGGQLYLWGGGELGQQGNGERANVLVPSVVQYFVDHRIVISSFSLGCAHSVAVSDEQLLYAWGEGKWGKLGLGHDKDAIEPSVAPLANVAEIRSAECGYAHTILIVKQGIRWHPRMHYKMPVQFKREVACVMMAHADATLPLSALPREILYEIFHHLANL